MALTRAKHAVMVFGNARTLSMGGGVWAQYLQWVRTRGCVIGYGNGESLQELVQKVFQYKNSNNNDKNKGIQARQ